MSINREMHKDVLCDIMEYCCCLVTKSCLTLLWPDPPELYLTRLLCPWESPGKNTGVGCHFLHQGIFSTQGSNSCLLLGRQILYHCATWEVMKLLPLLSNEGLLRWHSDKKLICQCRSAKDMGSTPGLGRSLREGNDNLLYCSFLKRSTDRGAWQATVHRVSKSQTRLSHWACKH